MNTKYNDIDWYEFIINNHFKERNLRIPLFFSREFIAFKLPVTPIPQNTLFHQKVFEAKQRIYNNIHTITTQQLINIICDTSYIHL